MALAPEKMREIVLLLLFGVTNQKENEGKELQALVMHELKVNRSSCRDGWLKVQSIREALPEIDRLIHEVALSFSFDRIQAAELAILRLSFFELFVEKSLPPKVIFSEAKRLTKKFSEETAVSFIHALLSKACEKQNVVV